MILKEVCDLDQESVVDETWKVYVLEILFAYDI